MAKESQRIETDITVYRCDHAEGGSACHRTTASFATQDAVTVILDPAWATVRVGISEDRYFCSWAHLTAWMQAEEVKGGALSTRLKKAASDRDHRESTGATTSEAFRIMREASGNALTDASWDT